MKVHRSPGEVVRETAPTWASTIDFAIARPRPVLPVPERRARGRDPGAVGRGFRGRLAVEPDAGGERRGQGAAEGDDAVPGHDRLMGRGHEMKPP